ncbi:hypothetical protein EV363DRAFT_1262034 [Boletus edulis]|nr:hypothetical protein EV363DRAFT_1262034 [Boletus edulis]
MTGEQVTTYSEEMGKYMSESRDEYTTKWKREWNKTIHIRWHNASDRNEIIKNMRTETKEIPTLLKLEYPSTQITRFT